MSEATYVLLRRHRINGVTYGVGVAVVLPEQVGDWLATQAIARRAGSSGADVVRAANQAMALPVRTQATAPKAVRCCGWK